MHRSRVDAFRHRAGAIMTDHGTVSYVEHGLTLTSHYRHPTPSKRDGFGNRHRAWAYGSSTISAQTRSACARDNRFALFRIMLYWVFGAWTATMVMRQGLWPIFRCAREAVNPAAANLTDMSASL